MHLGTFSINPNMKKEDETIGFTRKIFPLLQNSKSLLSQYMLNVSYFPQGSNDMY